LPKCSMKGFFNIESQRPPVEVRNSAPFRSKMPEAFLQPLPAGDKTRASVSLQPT
jgi:hypothetical protein